MINIYPSYYKNFKCAAGDCADTCCAKWEIVVDEVSANFYKGIKTPFGDRLRSSLTVDTDGDTVFINRNNRCPFLNDSNLCDIYINLGGDKLCDTCAKFPRFSTSFGGSREWGISLSCPAACELIVGSDLELETVPDDDDPDLNELDAEVFLYLKKVREAVFSRIRDGFTLSGMLAFGKAVEENINNRDFSVPGFDDEGKLYFDKGILERFEYLTDEGREKFLSLSSLKEIKVDTVYKRIFAYYIYRYLLASVYDGRYYKPFYLSCLALSAIDALALQKGLQVSEAAVLFAKEIEHSNKNIDILT